MHVAIVLPEGRQWEEKIPESNCRAEKVWGWEVETLEDGAGG